MRKKHIKITNKHKEREHVIIENTGKQPNILIQLKSAGNDPLLGEQTITLKKREDAIFPKDRLYWDSQINNLKKKGFITVKPISKID